MPDELLTYEERSARCEFVRRNALLREAGIVPRYYVPTRHEYFFAHELVLLARALHRQLDEPSGTKEKVAR